MEETNLGVAVGVPMNVVEPREKDLPREPVAMGRNRSGTGKSLKDKKSVFGVLTGELIVTAHADRLRPPLQGEGSGHFNAL